MSYRIAEPLPECSLCEDPTLREVHERNGGLCSRCAAGIAATVRMLPIRDADELQRQRDLRAERSLDETVFVERYLPPVPRQPQLPGVDQ